MPAVGSTTATPFTQAQIQLLMKTEFARARRYGFALSCLLMEVDRLQSLVDIHGARLRDAVREGLCTLVSEKTRGADTLGLITEDRYLLVLPHTDEDAALLVADRLRTRFAAAEVTVGGQVLALTLSIGVSTCNDQETLFFDTMLSRAEVALDWAVEAGGNQVAFFRRDRFVGS